MTDTEKRPCVFFYVQHLLGIGHIARASRIAKALQADGFDVVLVTGGTPVPGFPGEGICHVELPPIAVSDGNFAVLSTVPANRWMTTSRGLEPIC